MEGWPLIAAAALMGLAGLPHCVAMCAAPCAAAAGRGAGAQPIFQAARVVGYAAGGALAAASVGALREGLAFAPLFRPLWTLLHLGALAVGLWMLLRGRWPGLFMQRRAAVACTTPAGWQRIAMPLRSAGAGAAWIAWPCALSQSALLVAALADTPGQGAAAMGAFALASSPALWLGPVVLRRWSGVDGAAVLAWPVRAAGALMAAGAAWALGHGLWERVVAWCG